MKVANAFWQAVVRFDKTRISPDIAFRNTIGIVTPLLIGAATGNPAAGAVAALGALNVCYSDSRDAYGLRGERMLLASVLVALAATTGALAARNGAAAALAAMVWALGAGMLVVLGQRAGDLGAISLVTLIVFGARQLSLREALFSGLLALSGGLLQTLLSIATWPVNRHDPERILIGGLYRTLAEIALSPAGSGSPPPATAAVLNARESLAGLDSTQSPEAESLNFLLDQAERIRLSLLTLRRLTHRLDRDAHCPVAVAALKRVLASASAALLGIGECAEKRQASCTADGFIASVAEFRKTPPPAHPSTMAAALLRDSQRHVDRLAGQIRAAAALNAAGARRNTQSSPPATNDDTGRRARLLANLSFRSTAFRHAVRLALCVGLGGAIARGLQLDRPYWLPLTIAIVLKPDFVGTFSRGVLRIAGTMAGLLVATLAVHLLPSGTAAHIGLLAAFSFVLRWIGPANYGIVVAAVSGIVVLLIAMTGVNPNDAIVARAVNTLLGGAVAAAAYWLWPTWERTQIGPVLSEMLEEYSRYFRLVMSGNSAALSSRHRRNAGRVARSNAEASAGRLAGEPGVTMEQRTQLNEILLQSNSFVRAVMALESDYDGTSSEAVKAALRGFTETGTRALELMATALRKGEKPAERRPDLRAAWTELERSAPPYSLLATETDRIATSLNTLWEQVAKWLSLQ